MIALWILGAIALLFGVTVFFGAPYVPSRRPDVRAVFDDLYPLSETDTLLDIGSGDGVVLREAAKRGAHAIGYEINPVLVLISRYLSRGNRLVQTDLKNFWTQDFPAKTTVVYVFGESRDIRRMAARVQQQVDAYNRPMHLISYGFAVPGHTQLASTKSHHLYSFVPSHTKSVTSSKR